MSCWKKKVIESHLRDRMKYPILAKPSSLNVRSIIYNCIVKSTACTYIKTRTAGWSFLGDLRLRGCTCVDLHLSTVKVGQWDILESDIASFGHFQLVARLFLLPFTFIKWFEIGVWKRNTSGEIYLDPLSYIC